MFFLDLIFVLMISVLLTLIIGAGLRKHRFGTDLLIFFMILFLATWAGGTWINPIGPVLWGVSWMSFMVVGVSFAILLSALVAPVRYHRHRGDDSEKGKIRAESAFVIDMFFWIMTIGLLIAIVAHYI